MASSYEGRTIADPDGNFIFELSIDGITVAQFMEASGLKSTTEVFEIQEGGINGRTHKLAGQTRWENIILRHGTVADTSLIEWREEVLNDEFAGRRKGSIIMRNLSMQEIRRYDFHGAWPVSYEAPALNAQGAEIAVEVLELAHHGISVVVTAYDDLEN